MNEPISISQKIYLLAIHPKKGGIVAAAHNALNFTLIGAIFLELYLAKNLEFENKRIVLVNESSSNTLHQFVLDKIAKSNRNLRISTWINKFNFSMRHIRTLIIQDLEQKRFIKMEEKRFLFFHWKSPAIGNFQVLYRLLDEVENHIFRGTDIEEELVLLSFLPAAGLLRRLYPEREKRKMAQNRLKKMMVGNQVSMAVRNAIMASQVVAASVAASTAAVASSS